MSSATNAGLTVAIAGNPNCGKSALFNKLTGIRQQTGNWPGVTVERKSGRARIDDRDVQVVDLPGIYTVDAASIDEQVARDYLLSGDADLVVDVVDAANLERNLYLTVQLLELGVPVVLALNMMDVARSQGIHVDAEALSTRLGCAVVPIVAKTGEGLSELQAAIIGVASGKRSGGYPLALEDVVEQAVVQVMNWQGSGEKRYRRWQALHWLENASTPLRDDALNGHLDAVRDWVRERCGEDAALVIADSRYTHAHTLVREVVSQDGSPRVSISDRIDALVIGRWTGIPVFLVVMYTMFLFAINIGGAFIDVFDGVAGALFVDGVGHLVTSAGLPDVVRVLLADGVGGGLQVVATFIPIIAALYLFLSALEDSGYMARAAFVMDRTMRTIGLPGKAFVPLIVGFGCNVPAIMATRTLENERERKLTILMNPFMSCGARLPVYALFAAAFFPNAGQNVVFALYLIGILVAILTGFLMKGSLLPGNSTGFAMELPPYHVPSLRGVLLRCWDRVRFFIREAGRVIIVMVVLLNLLSEIGTDGSMGKVDTGESVLGATSKVLTPVFAPMGIREDNWPAVVGIFSGVLAKEVVVGTLDSLYTRLSNESAPEAEQPFDLGAQLSDAMATVPANLGELAGALLDPLGLADAVADGEAARDANAAVFGAMQERFDGQAGAFAFLLFVLLYSPCVATIAVIVREAGAAWAAFVTAWTTFVAYLTASVFYQVAIFAEQPWVTAAWVVGSVTAVTGIGLFLRWWARRDVRHPASTGWATD